MLKYNENTFQGCEDIRCSSVSVYFSITDDEYLTNMLALVMEALMDEKCNLVALNIQVPHPTHKGVPCRHCQDCA
jgi:hypothetical protein